MDSFEVDKSLYEVGIHDLHDIWDSDLEPMADVFREPEPEWSATLLDSRSYVLHDRLMTDAALGAAPIKTEHSYSAAPDSPLGLEAIDAMEEDVFPALASRRRASRDSESPVTVKDEPMSEPASPESCRPLSPSPPPPSPSPTIVKREPRTPVQQSVLKAPTTILVSAARGSLFAPQKVVVPKLSIKIEPSSGFPLPPTPPSSTSSDSEGNLSPDHDPVSPRHPQQQQAPRLFLAAANRQPIQTPLISSQPKGSTGTLMLTEEEKRTLLAEGYPIPTRLPLTKAEEKSLKKIRRKIKNKISAQESRRKKKEYMDALERKVELLSGENSDYKKKIENLEESNTSLLSQLHKLQALLARGTTPAARFASALAARTSQK